MARLKTALISSTVATLIAAGTPVPVARGHDGHGDAKDAASFTCGSQ